MRNIRENIIRGLLIVLGVSSSLLVMINIYMLGKYVYDNVTGTKVNTELEYEYIKLDPGQKLIQYNDGKMLTRSMRNGEHAEWWYYTDSNKPNVILIIQERSVKE